MNCHKELYDKRKESLCTHYMHIIAVGYIQSVFRLHAQCYDTVDSHCFYKVSEVAGTYKLTKKAVLLFSNSQAW